MTTEPENMTTFGGSALSPKAGKVLAAARSIFLAHGFSGATTDMIQREAGVSKSTVYAHYANKEALFVAVIESQCAEFAARMRGIQFTPGKLRETLVTLARNYLAIVLSPTALSLFRTVIAEAPRFPDLARIFYLAGPGVITGMIADQLANAVDSDEVDLNELGIDTAATLFLSLVRSEPQMQCLMHPNSTPSAVQIDHWVASAVTTFMKAYGHDRVAGASSRK